MTARPEDPHIGLVVEGPGDRSAVPILLRRRLVDRGIYQDILGKPISVNGRSQLTRAGGIEGFVATAGARPGCVAVLVVADSDKDDSAVLTKDLTTRAEGATGKLVVVHLAERDFEDWLYSSAETLELGITFTPAQRGLNELKRAIAPAKYVKPTWQARLSSRMDLYLGAARSTSFFNLIRKFDGLCRLT